MNGFADIAQCIEHTAFAFAKTLADFAAKFDQARAVRGDPVSGLDLVFIALFQGRALDVLDLKAQHVHFLFAGTFCIGEFIVFRLSGPPEGESTAVLLRQFLSTCIGIQHLKLTVFGVEGLVIVRSVQIDQMLTELLQHDGGDRRAINELLVRRGTDHTADDQGFAIQCVEASFRENGIHGGGLLQIKHRFHGAGFRACADQAAVSTLSENELQCAHDDGFARACFTSNGDQTGT